MNLTSQILNKIPTHEAGRQTTFDPNKVGPFITNLNQTFVKYQINTPARISAFMAQAIVETMSFKLLKENTNYTLKNAMKLWPRRFNIDPNSGKSIDYLEPINYANLINYQNNSDAIVNRAYAGKNGNSQDESVGDGLKYVGRGIFQITGKDNYANCGKALNVDLVNQPGLLEQTFYACQSAGWFWSINKFNVLADNGQIDTITKRLNGGSEKAADRKAFWLDFFKRNDFS